METGLRGVLWGGFTVGRKGGLSNVCKGQDGGGGVRRERKKKV